MELVALQCPKCGGPVKHDEKDKTYVCEYCGLAFMLKTDSDEDNYEKNIKLADSAYEKGRIKEAKHYYRLALESNVDDWKSDLMIAACDLQMSTWKRYNGPEFEKTLKDALVRIRKLPEDMQTDAMEWTSETINECAVYCNNKLYWDVRAAQNRYEGLYHEYSYDDDDDNDEYYEHVWDERKKPAVSLFEVTQAVEKWILQAIDIVFDIVPEGQELTQRQIDTVATQFNYIYACENYSHIKMGYLMTSSRDRNMERLKSHNPGYYFISDVNVTGYFHE